MKIDDITEAKPTKTKDAIDWATIFDEPVSKGELEPAKPSNVGAGAKAKTAPDLKKATADRTRSAMKGVSIPDDAGRMLGQLNIPDDALAAEPDIDMDAPAHYDVPGEVRPVTADNLPAIIRTEIARINSEVGDPSAINPEWHQIKNLPGYISRQIRTLGRAVFQPFTRTPIEDISVIANFGGQGPNSEREVAGVVQWLMSNANKIDTASMDFNVTMPGYDAETALFEISGMRFLVVRDFAGHYVYGWPDQDSVRQVDNQPTRQIRSR